MAVRYGRAEVMVAKKRKGGWVTVFDLFRPGGQQRVSRAFVDQVPTRDQQVELAKLWDAKLNRRDPRTPPPAPPQPPPAPAPAAAPAVDWRDVVQTALDVYCDEIQFLRSQAEAFETLGGELRLRATDMAGRAGQLRRLLEITDPTKPAAPAEGAQTHGA